MVIVTKLGINEDQIIRIEERIRAQGLGAHRSPGTSVIVIGVIGSPSESFREQMAVFSGVDRVIRIGRPYTLAGRGDGREDTSFQVGDAKVGGGEGVTMIAGALHDRNPRTTFCDRGRGQGRRSDRAARRRLPNRALPPTASRDWR